MQPEIEKKFVIELLKTNDAAKAAYELLTNGTQLSSKDKEELEQKLLKNLYLCMKYKRDYRPGHWPEFVNLMQTIDLDAQHYDPQWSKVQYLDFMLFIASYTEEKVK